MTLSPLIRLPSGRQAKFDSGKIFQRYCHAVFPLVPSTVERLTRLLQVVCGDQSFDWRHLKHVPRELQAASNPSIADVEVLEDWLLVSVNLIWPTSMI